MPSPPGIGPLRGPERHPSDQAHHPRQPSPPRSSRSPSPTHFPAQPRIPPAQPAHTHAHRLDSPPRKLDKRVKRRRSHSAPPPVSPALSTDVASARARPRRNTRTPSGSSSHSHHAVSEPESGRTEGGGTGSEYTDEASVSPGQWCTKLMGRVYELVVVQHPQRARACGFGDKDRRPLSPPPIVRLYIRTAFGEEVDPTKIDIAFLVLMVDLWSADGEHERNIVMHPGSAVRPSTPPSRSGLHSRDDDPGPSSRPGTGNSSRPTTSYQTRFSPGRQQPGWQLTAPISPDRPISQGPSPHSRLAHEQIPMPLPVPSPPLHHGRFAVPIPPPRPPNFRSSSYTGRPPSSHFEVPRPVTAPAPSRAERPPLGIGHGGPLANPTLTLPPISAVTESLSRPGSSRLTLAAMHMRSPRDSRPHTATTDTSGQPSWTTESTQPTDYSFGRGSTSTWHSSSFSSVDSRDRDKASGAGIGAGLPSFGYGHPQRPGSGHGYPGHYALFHPHGQQGHAHGPPVSPGTGWHPGPSLPVSPAAIGAPAGLGHGGYFGMAPVAEVDAPPSPPRDEEEQEMVGAGASYSRVLVGSLCATCLRLQDEDGEQGLFFFAHDLGIRTEGTFRLKFSLADMSSLLQANTVPGMGTPALAEAFSDPFTVYSAKKFPGVVPTTELTKLFAGQNVRLPTRQRKAASRGDGDGEDGDDD